MNLARQRFLLEIQQPEAQIDLARAALYIAQEERPDLDVEEYLAGLDTMAAELRERLPAQAYPLRIIGAINQFLFVDLGFRGNTTHYYDPRNSFLDQVIDRRTGIPLTLSLVYLELAKRVGFPMVGIGLPGHFLVRPDFEAAGIFVDPFHQGDILFTEDCQERLVQTYGPSARLDPRHLDPVGPRQLLARMLSNLKAIYLSEADLERSLAAIERILALVPNAALELRDRGFLYYQLGRWPEARRDLEAYLDTLSHKQRQEASDALVIAQLLQRMGSDP